MRPDAKDTDPMNMMATNTVMAVSVRQLAFRHRMAAASALNGIDLEIGHGELVVVMGPSGAGKSTFCQSLNGLVPHLVKGTMTGEVRIGNRSTKENPVAGMAEDIGLVFQDFEAQLFSTNVRLEVAFAIENLGVPRDEIIRRVEQCLAEVNLKGFEARQPASLSGGQKQRLAIASVLAAKPGIMVLDEPTTDLDPVGKQEVFEIAKRLRANGTTLIVVEHETTEALAATRVVLMAEGQVKVDGTPDDVLRRVEDFASLRIMPLQVPEFFARMGVARQQRPLTVEEGAEAFRSSGWSIAGDRLKAVLARDEKRAANYGEVVVDVQNLIHRYPTGLAAVQDVSFQVKRGEFVAILGQNGSGKTTLIKHLNGLLRPTSGTVKVGGVQTDKATILEIGSEVGYVFQNPDHQIFSDTVFDEVAFGLRNRKMSEDLIKERVAEALAAVDLQGREGEDPFSMTKGERQRVAVATALAVSPKLLILDEPTTGLDYQEQQSMMALIKRLNEAGSTILIITHTMWVVSEYAHRTLIMKDGRLVQNSTVREAFALDEKALSDLSLQPPHIVSLGNRLGATVLSVDELMEITEGRS